jgi:signal transduction histidine kinase
MDDKRGLALCLSNIGVAYDYLSEYDKALEIYLQAFEISEEISDTASAARALSGMGIVHWYLDNFEIALDYYSRALSLHEARGNMRDVAGTLNNIGLVYWHLDSLDRALEYYFRALPLIKQFGGPRGIADVTGNIGEIYGEMGQYREAIKYRSQSLTLCQEVGYAWGTASGSINLGDLYLKVKNVNAARPYIEDGLALAQEIDARDLIKQGYKALSDLHVVLGDYKNAFEYHTMYSNIKDSIYVDGARKAAETKARYDAEKKEKEIALLFKEKAIQDLELEHQGTIRNSLIGATILLLLLAALMYNRYRLKTRSNIELALAMQQLKDTQQQLILKEKMVSLGALVAGVAHEMNNPVGAIKSSADNANRAISKIRDAIPEQILKDHAVDTTILQKALDALDTNSRVTGTACERVTTMVHALKTFANLDEAAFKVVNIHDGIESTLVLINSYVTDRIEVVRNYGDIPSIGCYPDQLNQVFMNLLLNAAEAIEDQGRITIETSQRGSYVHIRISDTGRGISSDLLDRVFDPGYTTKGVGVGTGLGLSMSYNIVRKHGGEITCESVPGQGTAFEISLLVTPRLAAEGQIS